MYCIKLFDSLFNYEKKKEDVIVLDFPKSKDNYMFMVKVDKDGLNITPEDEYGKDADKINLKLLDETQKIFSEFLTKEFGDKEVELYCFFDGKKYYLVDIYFNTRWFVQEDIEDFAKKYKFNALKTIFKGDINSEKMKEFNTPVLVKSRFEEDFFTTGNPKERYVIFGEKKNGK